MYPTMLTRLLHMCRVNPSSDSDKVKVTVTCSHYHIRAADAGLLKIDRCWASSPVLDQSINQSNPVLLKERVRIPRTRRAGGAAKLWGRLLLDGVGSCRLFFTDDLHDNLSWVPASDKPHTFKYCFTHSRTLPPRDWPGPHPIYLTIGTHDMPKPLKRTLPNQNGKVAYP